jgi:hypothetical protein
MVVPDPAIGDVLSAFLNPAKPTATPATTAPDPNFRLPSLGDPKVRPKRPSERRGSQVAVDYRRVSIPRWVLYAQGVLIAVVAAVGFGSGYWLGRAAQPQGEEAPPAEHDAVLIRGSVHYRNDRGLKTPDADAVIVIVPKDAIAEHKIDIKGLRPRDPAPTEKNPAIQAIELLDGAYARADRMGKFSVVLRPGSYWVLALSRHVARPASQPPKPDDLDLLGRYFLRGGDLLGTAKYELRLRQLAANEPLEYDFGPEK